MPRSVPSLAQFKACAALILPLLAGACTATIGPGGQGGSGGQATQAGAGADAVGPASPLEACTADAALPIGAGGERLARLTHVEWSNAIRDLIGNLSLEAWAPPLPDPPLGRFDSVGSLLQVSEGLRLDYQRLAESIAAAAVATPQAVMSLLPEELPAEATARARAFIEHFGLRAYRRPLSEAEVSRYLALFTEGSTYYAGADPFLDGVRVTLEAFLQSPHFLYRSELGNSNAPQQQSVAGRVMLGPYEIAAKLSFALTRTIPDRQLLDLALSGGLAQPAVARAQAERLLATDAGIKMVGDLHRQMLRLDKYANIPEKDPERFPEYVSTLGADMLAESELFVQEVIRADGGLRELLSSRFTFVNEPLAAIYGIQGVVGDALTRVELDPVLRAGILTQPGFLATHAGAWEVDSIHRGVAVHFNLLCTELPPPAPGASGENAVGNSNRERIESITGPGTCGQSCHATLINPIGFAFEAYDAIGRHRTTDNGLPIDDSGEYDFGEGPRSYRGAVELSSLIADAGVAHACYARGFLETLLGRPKAEADAALLAHLGARSQGGCGGARALALALVTSDTFLTRTP